MKPTLICLFLLLVVSCKSPEARYPVSHKSGSFIKKSAERNKQLYQAEQSKIEDIIKSQTDVEYIASDSGFWYAYIQEIEEDSIRPGFGDVVSYNYDVRDLSGTIIYSEEELGQQTYAMDQEELFSGLREGLKLMKAGETVTFLFPSQKAYGFYGDEDRIGTNIPLICRVTVNSITRKESN